MALKDIFNLFDDKLADVFAKKAYDPTKDRAKLVKRLETQKAKFLRLSPRAARRISSSLTASLNSAPCFPADIRWYWAARK
ncbi:hypothetical protein P0F65_05240 [Sphingomonas sp. I4]